MPELSDIAVSVAERVTESLRDPVRAATRELRSSRIRRHAKQARGSQRGGDRKPLCHDSGELALEVEAALAKVGGIG